MKKSMTHLLLNIFEQKEIEKNVNPPQENNAETSVDPQEKFEQLIKGEYKDIYNRKIKEIISKRLKGVDALKEKLASMQNIIDILSEKYGVDADDIASLSAKVMEDDSLISEQADKKGVDVNSYRYIKSLEQENRYYKERMERDKEKSRMADAIGRWYKETEQVAKDYPDFDINQEMENAMFIQLIRSGVDMKTAYEVFDIVRAMAAEGNPNSVSDAGVGALAARSAVLGAQLNVRINAAGLADREAADRLCAEAAEIAAAAIAAEAEVLEIVNGKI